MPKKYVIYRENDSFVFEATNENGEFEVINSVKKYYDTITSFIENGYSITYENNEKIVLTSKKVKGQAPSILIILVDERLMASKYFKVLKDDIKKVKKAKGHTVITIDENGNKTMKKYFGGPLKYIQEHTAMVGIAITLVGTLMMYGIFSVRTSLLNGKDKRSLSSENKFTVSMANDAHDISPANTEEIFARFPEEMHTPWNVNEDGLKIFPFQKSFIIDEDFFSSIINQNKVNEELDSGEEAGAIEEVVMMNPIEVEYNNFLKIYAEYFHLDPDKVIDFAKQVTENYTLPFEEINGTTSYDLASKEAACLVFVHNLSKNDLALPLSDYGLSYNYFLLDPSITTLPYDKILANGQTFEEFYGHICDLLQADKYWLLGVTYLETGHLRSSLAMAKNNFGGLRGKDGFYTYITPEAGIISHCRNLKGYESLGLKSMYELAGKYVYGNKGLIYQILANPDDEDLQALKASMDTWISSVKWFHNDFLNRTEEVFGDCDASLDVEAAAGVLG